MFVPQIAHGSLAFISSLHTFDMHNNFYTTCFFPSVLPYMILYKKTSALKTFCGSWLLNLTNNKHGLPACCLSVSSYCCCRYVMYVPSENCMAYTNEHYSKGVQIIVCEIVCLISIINFLWVAFCFIITSNNTDHGSLGVSRWKY